MGFIFVVRLKPFNFPFSFSCALLVGFVESKYPYVLRSPSYFSSRQPKFLPFPHPLSLLPHRAITVLGDFVCTFALSVFPSSAQSSSYSFRAWMLYAGIEKDIQALPFINICATIIFLPFVPPLPSSLRSACPVPLQAAMRI